jgi:hypothetical protein
MRVSNMKSARGNDVPNQFIITDDNSVVFQSYRSVIAKKTAGGIILDSTYWDYSNTTRKYRNQFLGMNSGEIKAAIKDGRIKLEHLN